MSWVSSRILALVVATVLWSPAFVAAQSSGVKNDTEVASAKAWTMPRTPDGKPDLQGYYTTLSFTPMERPAKYQGREFLTEQEMADVYKKGVTATFEGTPEEGIEGFGELYNPASVDYDVTTYALSPWQNGLRPNRRSSLVVDPPDGRIPSVTPEAKARPRQRAGFSYSEDDHHGGAVVHADVPADLGTGTSCINQGGGPPILPAEYNSNLHIVQSPEALVIEKEVGSELRVIPLDGTAHAGAGIRQWHGDGRGHWEGDTLVVETTNFRPENVYRNANPKTLKITERFKRVSADQIEYSFTVDDPTTWTKPWTAIVPLSTVPGPLFEYACSEDNNDAVNILAGARAQDKVMEEKTKSAPISRK